MPEFHKVSVRVPPVIIARHDDVGAKFGAKMSIRNRSKMEFQKRSMRGDALAAQRAGSGFEWSLQFFLEADGTRAPQDARVGGPDEAAAGETA